nr:protein DOWNY MILDEW RESISTANCE 6-like [Ipomoea batatas]
MGPRRRGRFRAEAKEASLGESERSCDVWIPWKSKFIPGESGLTSLTKKYVRPELDQARGIVSNYVKKVGELGFVIEEVIPKSLDLEKSSSIREVLGKHMAVNFYPPCPETTYGLPGHTDPNALTILLQDTQVSGIQVLKDGKWLA